MFYITLLRAYFYREQNRNGFNFRLFTSFGILQTTLEAAEKSYSFVAWLANFNIFHFHYFPSKFYKLKRDVFFFARFPLSQNSSKVKPSNGIAERFVPVTCFSISVFQSPQIVKDLVVPSVMSRRVCSSIIITRKTKQR